MFATLTAAALFLTQIVGLESQYTVRAGDSLTKIGARFGVSTHFLAETNGLKLSGLLQIGQILKVDNRHIVPSTEGVRIVVNVPQKMLFWVSSEGTVQGFPVAAGKAGWKTPLGDFTVGSLETDPTWDVPLSIQAEMRTEGKPVVAHVPPSPENPLGKFWVGLSIPNVGIHGTNAPSSIYSLVTHGCIRLHPDDIEYLFSKAELGIRGRIIYEPVLMARVGDSVFLEVHPDAYKKAPVVLAAIVERARLQGYVDLLDRVLVEEVLQRQDGIAHDVTRR